MMTEREIGLILAKLDALHEDMQEIKESYQKQDSRIDSLETFKAWASGAGALCVALFGFVISIFK